MQTVKIPYGRGTRHISVDDDAFVLEARLERANIAENEADTCTVYEVRSIVKKALNCPVDSDPLSVLARGKKKIVIITSDHTRPVPSSTTLPLILSELREGSPDAEISILVATGLHRETTWEELVSKFGKHLLETERFVMHHSTVASESVHIGSTSNNSSLKINRLAYDADLLIAEGFIEPHFFAGFSGGGKSILPGIADAKSICANHCAGLINHPCSGTGITEGNPIYAEMQEAARLAKLAFILNVVLDNEKRIVAAFAGNPRTAHLKGCQTVRNMFCVEARKADIVVVSNGGYPLDQNIYQAVKGMTAAEATCRENGVIIVLAECCNGYGSDDFYQFFDNRRSIDFLYNKIMETPAEDTEIDQWEAQILLRILGKHTIILISSLPKDIVEVFRLHHADSFDEAYRLAKSMVQNPCPAVAVIPDGVSVIIQ